MKKNIAIVAGGDSSEMGVSLKSANGLYTYIDDERYNKFIVTIHHCQWNVKLENNLFSPIDKNDFSFTVDGKKTVFDFAYITIHGTPGENGLIEGYLDIMGIPYSTCDVLTSALTFNKYKCNRYLMAFKEDLPELHIAKSILLKSAKDIRGNEGELIGFPCFVKPNGSGSSYGVTKVTNEIDLAAAINCAFKEDSEIIIEKAIQGTEVTCGCYKTKEKEVVFPITEVVTSNEFFDYAAKYNGEAKEITPARIPAELFQKIQKMTLKIYDIIGCNGIIRADYIISDNNIFILEINTTPGMTQASFVPQQIRAAGLDIKEVLTDIIEDSLLNN